MDRGALVAAEAPEWCGTPFKWQQCVKGPGGGCDCKMLVVGVARTLGFPEASSMYALLADYSPKKPVPVKVLTEGMEKLFDVVPAPRGRDVPDCLKPGDVLQLEMMRKPQHLAIVTEAGLRGRAVHAQIGPKDWVKETRLDVLLRKYPLRAVYRWREL